MTHIIPLAFTILLLAPCGAAAGPSPAALDSLTILSGGAAPAVKENVPEAAKIGSGKKSSTETVKLRYEEKCILRLVAAEMKIPLKKEIPLPGIYFGSKVPFAQFLAAYRTQSDSDPNQVSNVYILKNNEIYLSDKAVYYGNFGRALDDSLAHEYVHYLQVKYRGYTIEDCDDNAENQAIHYQTLFREKYIAVAPPEDVCAQ